MTKTKYNTVESFPGTSIKSGRIKLVLWAQTFPLSEMMRSCKCLPRASEIPTFTYNWTNSVIIKNTIILNIIQKLYIITD